MRNLCCCFFMLGFRVFMGTHRSNSTKSDLLQGAQLEGLSLKYSRIGSIVRLLRMKQFHMKPQWKKSDAGVNAISWNVERNQFGQQLLMGSEADWTVALKWWAVTPDWTIALKIRSEAGLNCNVEECVLLSEVYKLLPDSRGCSKMNIGLSRQCDH